MKEPLRPQLPLSFGTVIHHVLYILAALLFFFYTHKASKPDYSSTIGVACILASSMSYREEYLAMIKRVRFIAKKGIS